MKHELKLLSIIVSAFLAGYIFELAIDSIGAPTFVENTVEIIAEFFSVLVAFSIFSLTWIAYTKSKDNHALYLGSTFFVVGILILFHALSYPFMAPFITPNTVHKADYFFAESRFVLAILFLASAIVYKDTLPKFISKIVLIASTIILSIIFLFFTIFYQNSVISHNLFFGFFPSDPDNLHSAATVFTLTLITGITLSGSYLYAKRAKETGDKDLTYLVDGSVIIAISNLVYFYYEFSAHFLIITGFYLFYLGLYKSSIELPYEKLAIAEEKLRHTAEEKYRNIFDNANDAIMTLDIEGRITSWNNAAEELFGWKAEEIIGKTFSSLNVPDSLKAKKEEIERNALAGKKVVGIEMTAISKDGNNVDVGSTVSPLLDANGNAIGFSWIHRDIRESKKAQEVLLKEKQRLEDVTSYANCGLLLLDNQGRITYANRIAQDWFGYQIEGRTCREIYNVKDPMMECATTETLRTGREAYRNIFMKLANGEEKFLYIVSAPLKDSNGNIQQINEIIIDVSEHKKAEGIQIENERLTYASRAKSDFLATMSHELRTPLNAIIGFSELMLGNTAGEMNVKQKRYVENINTSSKHLLALISDILDLSKVESGKIELAIEKLAVPEVINEGLILIKEKAMKHNIKLKTELDPELGFIEADRLRFKQVLFNLISNAVKFSKPEGGVVTVRAQKEGDMARISVSDTGIGIKEEDMGKLFKEFEQVSSGISRKYGGTGLGLAISRKLVELHGGSMWAESRYGEGSTFYFTLPLNNGKK